MTPDFDRICRLLAEHQIANPRLETRLLMAAVKQCPSENIYSDTFLTPEQTSRLEEFVRLRLAHYPLDKILGHRAFYKADFIVDESVLSPRPDTEILVEEALLLVPAEQTANHTILDLGTGSGCIIESLLAENPVSTGVAVDISDKSLQIARLNAQKLNLTNRLRFICADWFDDNFLTIIDQKFDLIVSNPPYIPTADISTLEPEVKNHDPLLALDGGKDGLTSYKRLAELAPHLLKPKGCIVLEVGINQAQSVAEIFIRQKMKLLKIAKDLGGIDRCLVLQKNSVK